MFTIRKKRQDYHNHLRLVEDMMSEQPAKIDESGQPQTPYKEVTMTFLCPEGFEPAAFIISAIDAKGQHFSNAPTNQPHLALRLGTIALDYVSQVAVLHIQAQMRQESPIITAPAHLAKGLVRPS